MQDTHIQVQRWGFKCFQVVVDYHFETDIRPEEDIEYPYISLSKSGQGILKVGYCSDGPSGPTDPTSDTIRPALTHDAKYRLMRAGLLDDAICKSIADRELEAECKQDGMCEFRADYFYEGVNLFGESSTVGGNPVIIYP